MRGHARRVPGPELQVAELLGEDRRAIRYPRVLYQARERVPVDVVVYHDPEFQEPWWLLVPSQSRPYVPGAPYADFACGAFSKRLGGSPANH
jgi:hypothetical protein